MKKIDFTKYSNKILKSQGANNDWFSESQKGSGKKFERKKFESVKKSNFFPPIFWGSYRTEMADNSF